MDLMRLSVTLLALFLTACAAGLPQQRDVGPTGQPDLNVISGVLLGETILDGIAQPYHSRSRQ